MPIKGLDKAQRELVFSFVKYWICENNQVFQYDSPQHSIFEFEVGGNVKKSPVQAFEDAPGFVG
jgi:hypothetical protein